jgi:CRISPR-associated protein Cas1
MQSAAEVDVLTGESEAQQILTDTRNLFDRVLDEHNLYLAWEQVRANDGCSGFDRVSVTRFAEDALARLCALRAEVINGLYRPQPLQAVQIPKPTGGMRMLAIPAVRDRVLQTAVARVLSPLLESQFDDASFAYRPGRSVAMAVQRVVRHRDAGLCHVLDADIEGFFDHIDHATLMSSLRAHLPAASSIFPLIELWLMADLREPAMPGRLIERGLPQGSPLSPLLSNLYLHPLDIALRAGGHALVRYADDFVVLCPAADMARTAQTQAQQVLSDLLLRLNVGKTRLTSFDQGFKFLGVRFVQRVVEPAQASAGPWMAAVAARAQQTRSLDSLDPALSSADQGDLDDAIEQADPASRGPLLHTLYVTEPGAALSKEHDRVVVTVRREVRASVPLGHLDQIAIMANAMVSTALIRACAARGISMAFNGSGNNEIAAIDRGGLQEQAIVALQWQSQDRPELHLLMARQFVEGKLHNCRTVLRRFTRREGRDEVHEHLLAIDDCQYRLATAQHLNALRGLEGTAARHHFAALRTLLPEAMPFPARQRRPPRDPVNALLSLGYAVLSNNMHTLIRLEGLNPHIGHLHRTTPGSLALVSDLIEEFRAPVVDAVVLNEIRQGRIRPQDFEYRDSDEGDGVCLLSSEPRRAFIKALETKLDSPLVHPRLQTGMCYRRVMQAQVRHYLRVLAREEAVYQPLKLR